MDTEQTLLAELRQEVIANLMPHTGCALDVLGLLVHGPAARLRVWIDEDTSTGAIRVVLMGEGTDVHGKRPFDMQPVFADGLAALKPVLPKLAHEIMYIVTRVQTP